MEAMKSRRVVGLNYSAMEMSNMNSDHPHTTLRVSVYTVIPYKSHTDETAENTS